MLAGVFFSRQPKLSRPGQPPTLARQGGSESCPFQTLGLQQRSGADGLLVWGQQGRWPRSHGPWASACALRLGGFVIGKASKFFRAEWAQAAARAATLAGFGWETQGANGAGVPLAAALGQSCVGKHTMREGLSCRARGGPGAILRRKTHDARDPRPPRARGPWAHPARGNARCARVKAAARAASLGPACVGKHTLREGLVGVWQCVSQ